MTTNKVIKPQIKVYQPKDYPQMQFILKEAGLYEEVMDNRTRINQKISRNPGSIIVAKYQNKLIGSIYIIEDSWANLLFRLAVKKEFRNMGVGSQLLQRAEKYTSRMGYPMIGLLVEENESKLVDFYKKRGYLITRYRLMYKTLRSK